MSLNGHRVWDCFPYAGYDPEPEILEIRLHELSDIVDYFVLVEAPLTHSGKTKPLYFQENKSRFERFLDRIIHVVVTDFPPADMTKLGESWKYERHQRDAIARGLSGAGDQDIVITSDLDEIPRAKTLKAYDPSMGLVGLNLSMHSYWLNMVNRETEYAWVKVLPYGLAKTMTHCQIRYTFGRQILPNGGWHFSYMGGPKEVIHKIESFAHQEYSIPRCKDPEAIRKRMEHGIDPHERSVRYQVEPLDDTYPKYVQANLKKFSHLIAGQPALSQMPGYTGPDPVTGFRGHVGRSGTHPLNIAPEDKDLRTVEWNKQVWDSYTWQKDGDEWDSFAQHARVPYEKWKDSLTRSFLIPYLGNGKIVVEIGPGHGRWSEMIAPRIKGGKLHLVDVTPKVIEYLKTKLKAEGSQLDLFVNDGKTIPQVEAGSVDFIWSFDTFVHIEELECRSYAREFARVLKRTGMGVIHHPGNPTPEQRRNGCRSQMTTQKWKDILRQNNLHVVRQMDSWDGGNVKLNNDMITMFVRP